VCESQTVAHNRPFGGGKEWIVALQFHELTVTSVRDETNDSRSFVLDVPDTLRERFVYRAGQFLTFEVPWDSFSIRRCYSLSSSPDVDLAHRITVKRVVGGRMSNWLIDNVKVGDKLRVSTPDGRFVLDPKAGPRPLTLLGGGSGITPLVSLMKSALACTDRSVKLVYANRDFASVILKHELDALARDHSARVELHYHFDAEAGLLTAGDIERLIAGREDGDHYVCGPAPFMDTVKRALQAAGVPSERRYFEHFVSGLDPDRRAILRVQAERNKVPGSFVVRLAGEVHTVPYEPGLTLLAAAHRSGVMAPSSCEDGYCGSCAAQLRKGKVSLRAAKALAPTEIAEGKILMCQAVPSSAEPLEVDCDARSSGDQPTGRARPPQPLLPRVLASIFVAAIFAMFFLLRSHR